MFTTNPKDRPSALFLINYMYENQMIDVDFEKK